MSSIVLDTSAVIAGIQKEPGGNVFLDDSVEWILSSVSFAEVVGVLMRKGYSRRDASESVKAFDPQIIDFDRALAEEAGAMILQTRAFGLSLGDRACLALAARENLPVLTADRAWRAVNIGVEICFIR